MKQKITILDYGCGNIRSVSKAIEYCGGQAIITSEPREISLASHLVLPGVGAFASAISRLHTLGLDDAIREHILRERPFLGICLGLQLLMSKSAEFGVHTGLNIFDGGVEAIPNRDINGQPHTVPHIGWNAVMPLKGNWDGSILENISLGAEVYFVHSFHAVPNNTSDILAITHYNGRQITAAISRDNVIGMQFHPEKSSSVGLKILQSFLAP